MLKTKSKSLEKLFPCWKGLLEAQVETQQQGSHVAENVCFRPLADGESLSLRKHVGLSYGRREKQPEIQGGLWISRAPAREAEPALLLLPNRKLAAA
jgi:hypothetical protein